jgi:hypothetical protein
MDDAVCARRDDNRVELSSGLSVGLPVRYGDWTGIMAHFPAPLKTLRSLLPSKKLEPVRLAPGTGILTLVAIEYRRLADLAPYNEVAIMIPVLGEPVLNMPALPLFFPSLFKKFGFFIHRMPVTTQDACELGFKVWGYPKFVADIDFEEIGNVRRCRLRADGAEILTLDVLQGPAKLQRVDFRIYSAKDDRLLRHSIETEGLYFLSILPGGASFTFGDHPLGQELQALGIGKKAIARVFGSNVRSLLHDADWRSPL